jgi:hypothetical protein
MIIGTMAAAHMDECPGNMISFSLGRLKVSCAIYYSIRFEGTKIIKTRTCFTYYIYIYIYICQVALAYICPFKMV